MEFAVTILKNNPVNTDPKVKSDIIAAAVLWWTNKLGGPPRAMDGLEGFGAILSIYVQEITKGNIEEDSKRNFAATLQKYLENEFSKSYIGSVTLSTDYGPEGILREACQDSRVTGQGFPLKTSMWVNLTEGKVTWSTVRGLEGQVYPPVES